MIPAYNCKDYITQALRSIQDQTVRDIRLIVVDDGSTDGTGAIVQAAASADSRIVYHRQDNAGIVAAMNAGLALCTAPFVARMDGDDISYADRFEKQLAYLEAHPNCTGVGCRVRHIDEHSAPLGTTSKLKDMALANCFSFPAIEPYIIHPMLMAPRAAIEKAGGYRPVYNAEDSDLYWRLKDLGDLHVIDAVLGDYRMHSGSVSSASIVNGRQQAVWSQLAALSEQRRQQKKPDIAFTLEFAARIRSQKSLQDILQAATADMPESDRFWLTAATCAKLLELCYYRPFEPDRGDIQYIVGLHKLYPETSQQAHFNVLKEAELSAGIRLLLSVRIADAITLVGIRNVPVLLVRSLFRIAMPESLKEKIKKATGRSN
nr:glycosyltransferase family A protein [Acetobacter conturbans]